MLNFNKFIKARIHEGHDSNDWDPMTGSYLFALKDKIYIIDLEQTVIMLRRAFHLIEKLVSKRGNLLYIPVNLEKRKSLIIESITRVPRMDYNYTRKRWHKQDYLYKNKRFKARLNTIERWRNRSDNLEDHWDQTALRIRTGSSSLNFTDKTSSHNIQSNLSFQKVFSDSIKLYDVKKFDYEGSKKMENLKKVRSLREKKFFNYYKKKVFSLMLPKKRENLRNPVTKKLKRTPHLFWAREQTDLTFVPEVVFLSDVSSNLILIKECIKLGIPVIGIVNSNTNPLGIQYPIPGNNNSNESIHFYLKLLTKSIAKAKVKEIQKWDYHRKSLQVLRFSRSKLLAKRKSKFLKRKIYYTRAKFRYKKSFSKKLKRELKLKLKLRGLFHWQKKKWFKKRNKFLRIKRKYTRKKRAKSKKDRFNKFKSLQFKYEFLRLRPVSSLFKKLAYYSHNKRYRSKISKLSSPGWSFRFKKWLRQKRKKRRFRLLSQVLKLTESRSSLSTVNFDFVKLFERLANRSKKKTKNSSKSSTLNKNQKVLIDKNSFLKSWFRFFKNKESSNLTPLKNKKMRRGRKNKTKPRLFKDAYSSFLFYQLKKMKIKSPVLEKSKPKKKIKKKNVKFKFNN